MTQYTVQNGQNLWKIVKQEYGLTNNSDIQKKVAEIVKLNNLEKGGSSIFANQKINLPDAKSTSVFDNNSAQSNNTQTSGSKGLTTNALIADSAVNLTNTESQKPEESKMEFIPGISKLPASDNAAASEFDGSTTTFNVASSHTDEIINNDNPFDAWGQECASSVSGVDYDTGNFKYSKDIKDFDLTGDEYRKLQSEDPQKAKELYTQKLLDNSSNEMKLYDKDGDEAYDLNEDLKKEVKDSEEYIGMPLNAEQKEALESQVFKTHAILDLNNNSTVDKNEYAAFFGTMDSLNEKDGKISRDEYNTALLYLEQDSNSKEAHSFRNKLKTQYNELFDAKTDDTKTE